MRDPTTCVRRRTGRPCPFARTRQRVGCLCDWRPLVARAKAAADKEAQAVLEMAELKAKNSRRLSENRLAEARKTRQSTKYREQKEIHAQVGLAIDEVLRQFVLELAGLSFVAVGQLHDRDAVSRRKDQLSIFQTTMSFITALIRMQESLEEKYNLKKADVKEGRGTTSSCYVMQTV